MNDLSGRKIGILGGSFDPIHNGHLAIAKAAYTDFQLDEVWFIPAGHSPNKNENAMTSPQLRAQMVALAIKPYPYFKLSTMEIEAEQTSYTYLTLTNLKNRYPDTSFYFIMGADSLDYFEEWRHPEIICEKAAVLVAAKTSKLYVYAGTNIQLNGAQHLISYLQQVVDIGTQMYRSPLLPGRMQ